MLSTFNKDPDMTMTALPEAPGDGASVAAQQESHHAGGHRVMTGVPAPPFSLTSASRVVRDSQLLCLALAHNVVHEEPFPDLPSGSRPGAGARGRLRRNRPLPRRHCSRCAAQAAATNAI